MIPTTSSEASFEDEGSDCRMEGSSNSSSKGTENQVDDELQWDLPRANAVFLTTHTHAQNRQPTLFGLDWSSDNHTDSQGAELQYVATAGGDQKGAGSTITIYKVEVNKRNGWFTPIQQYVDEDKKESFFACAFAGRSKYLASHRKTSEQHPSDGYESVGPRIVSPDSRVDTNYLNHLDDGNGSGMGPKLLCVGGASNVIKVIDLVQRKTVHLLRGHNNDVYDLKGSPVDEDLLLSCSVDESIRLWNLESFACVTRFAGLHGHSGMVLSVAWHPSGDRFASSGHDSSIRLWNLHDGRIHEALRACRSVVKSEKRTHFKSIEQPFPYFATKKVHRNVVDCIHFCGDLVLSKSSYNSIVLWQPKELDRVSSKVGSAAFMPPDDVIVLRTFYLQACDGLWFHRFTVDPACRLLAIGNMQSEIHIWELDTEKEAPSHKIKTYAKNAHDTVRNVAFNSNGSILVACTDLGNVYKCHQTDIKFNQTKR